MWPVVLGHFPALLIVMRARIRLEPDYTVSSAEFNPTQSVR